MEVEDGADVLSFTCVLLLGWGSVTDREALLPVILVSSGDTSDSV